MKYLTQIEVIDFMVTASDVDDWNQKRALVKANVDPDKRFEILKIIDSYGLCSHVLAGKNNRMLHARLNSIRNNHDRPYTKP